MTDTNTDPDADGGTDAETARETGSNDGKADGHRLSRRGALAALGVLGLGTVASGTATAAVEAHDHVSETWSGDPGTHGLRTDVGSDTNVAFYGGSDSTSARALKGVATATSGRTIGVEGKASSPDSVALLGNATATQGAAKGLEGRSKAKFGTGVVGNAQHATGTTKGVRGIAGSPNGRGGEFTNTASSGTAYGVYASTNSSDGYGFYTPNDVKFDGAVETGTVAAPGTLTVTTSGDRALHLASVTDSGTNQTINVVAGHSGNAAVDGAAGATIGGGGNPSFGNVVGDHYGTVGGGLGNTAGSSGADDDPTTSEYATVGGGLNNHAKGNRSVVAGGHRNTTKSLDDAIGGGAFNVADGGYATVAGGTDNTAKQFYATVGGGSNNRATAQKATVSGGGWTDTNDRPGTANRAVDDYGTVGGGGNNQAGSDNATDDSQFATVGGGEGNTASGRWATVAGGRENTASDLSTTVGGGEYNATSGSQVTIAGGSNNEATSQYATVGGGVGNKASSKWATVAGGSVNTASGTKATVGGGENNVASGAEATIPGGADNEASGSYAFAAGRRAHADHSGAFVWGDSTDADVTSTGADQFLIEAAGGVGIGTDSPGPQLHVADADAGANFSPERHITLIEDTGDNDDNEILALRTGYTGDPTVTTNFLTFFDGNDSAVGSIEGNGSGGVSLDTSSSDYAEYIPRLDADEEIEAADVVGVVDGQVTKRTADADQVLVVSAQPIVTGNSPGQTPEDREAHEVCAFVGQVPVRVRGPVATGDLVVPSGEHDGTGRAVSPGDYRPEDGPLVGRAWDASDGDGVSEVTVAVGLETGTAQDATLARQRAAVDELADETVELRAENERLRDRTATLEAENERKSERIETLEAEHDRLRDRLATLEAAVGGEGGAPGTVADD